MRLEGEERVLQQSVVLPFPAECRFDLHVALLQQHGPTELGCHGPKAVWDCRVEISILCGGCRVEITVCELQRKDRSDRWLEIPRSPP